MPRALRLLPPGFLAAVVLTAAPHHASGQDPILGTATDKKPNGSLMLAGHDLADNQQELGRLHFYVNRLQRYNFALDTIQYQLDRAPDPNAELTAIKKAFEQLQGAVEVINTKGPPQKQLQELDRVHAEAQRLQKWLEAALPNATYLQLEGQLSSLTSAIEAMNNAAHELSPISRAVHDPDYGQQQLPLISSSTDPGSLGRVGPVQLGLFLPKVQEVLGKVPSAAEPGKLPTPGEWQAAVFELTEFLKQSATKRTQLQTALNGTRSRLGQYIKAVEGLIKEHEDRKTALNDRLRAADNENNQSSVNKHLVYGVYGMIFVIFSFLAGIAWSAIRQGNTIDLLTKDRIVLEILSMGFLLLTVIILGTGKIIDKEGLAAILGTIAGYIFGQKAGEALAGRGDGQLVPRADFTAEPLAGSAPLDVVFTDTSANIPTAWEWDFGDGEGSTSRNPKHTYRVPREYKVTLTATNARGSNKKTRTVTVTDGGGDEGSRSPTPADSPILTTSTPAPPPVPPPTPPPPPNPPPPPGPRPMPSTSKATKGKRSRKR